MPIINIVYGDLLQQPVDVIVNAWNRNFIHGGYYYLKVCLAQ